MTGALSAGNPGAPINVGTCIDATRRFNRQLQGADEEPAKASTAAYGYDRRHDGYGYGHYHADPMVYYEGTAVVLWGTIDSITTPKHSIAATGGYAQSVPSECPPCGRTRVHAGSTTRASLPRSACRGAAAGSRTAATPCTAADRRRRLPPPSATLPLRVCSLGERRHAVHGLDREQAHHQALHPAAQAPD